MDERAFVERRRPEWERLTNILNQASSRGGLKSLSGEELADLGKLYRRVTSDLSYVNTNSASEQLITYLNELSGRAHGILYADAPTSGLSSIVNFLRKGFPILFRAKWQFIAVATMIMVISAIFAAASVKNNPDTAVYFLPKQIMGSGDG
ncbi:MAG TPA: hypothetical protein PLP86_00825 [Armatimonadota bacterium]|nr:hypothetical protein [Armatimonadota bacterium]